MFARSHRASVRVDLSVTRWHSSTRIEFERHRSPKAHSCCTQAERSGSVNASLLLLERSNMFYCPCQDAFNVFNFCGSDNQSIACDVLRLWRLMESVSLWGGAAEYLWMASNSRGQMNCWIPPPPALVSPPAPSVCLSLSRSQLPPRVSVRHPIVCDIQPQCENQQMGNFVCVGECGCAGMCVSVGACEGKRVGERELRSRE